jgi:hypothetical protein
MKLDFGGRLRWVTGTALVMTVALVPWMPEITARSSTRNSAHTPALRPFDSGDAKPETQKTAGETFKNIEVLKDIPASELIPSMRYVAASLGVGCDYCHQGDHFDNDDKPTKQRARNMMKMMVAINRAIEEPRRRPALRPFLQRRMARRRRPWNLVPMARQLVRSRLARREMFRTKQRRRCRA